jgi:hypothetical protein
MFAILAIIGRALIRIIFFLVLLRITTPIGTPKGGKQKAKTFTGIDAPWPPKAMEERS